MPWKIAPKQIVIVPVKQEKEILKKAEELKKLLESDYDVQIDASDKSPGEKFYYWEMKGVPLRLDLGMKEIEKKEFSIFRRDLNTKELVKEKDLLKYIEKTSKDYDHNLFKKEDELFKGRIQEASTKEEIKKGLENGKIVRTGFCSLELDGASCAEVIEKELQGTVRGRKLEKETPSGKLTKCPICGKKTKEVVYIARQY